MRSEIRIVIADDHPVVRRGLQQEIETDGLLKVVGEAGDGEAVLTQIRQLRPEIALIDLDMPKMDGLGVARICRDEALPVQLILLTMHDDEDLFHAAMDLGSRGYLLKDSALTEVVSALHAVAAGQYYVTPSLTRFLLHRREQAREFAQRQPAMADLSPTERRILRMIAETKSSKDIAGELCLHYRTVENRRTAICEKLGLHGPNALLKFALEHKLQI